MNKEQKEILTKIKSLVEELEATIQAETTKEKDKDWVSGQPNSFPKKG